MKGNAVKICKGYKQNVLDPGSGSGLDPILSLTFNSKNANVKKGTSMRKTIAAVIVVLFVFNSLSFAIGSKRAAYIGGTASDFRGAKKEIEGKLSVDEKELKFVHKFNDKEEIFSIPYNKIIDLEYGHKTGRRVGAAIATAILISPVGLFLLFSKKRKHYLTVGYYDAGKEQVAIFELGKDIVRATLPIVEARSGKKIAYQEGSGKGVK